jgi:hypothetical protein
VRLEPDPGQHDRTADSRLLRHATVVVEERTLQEALLASGWVRRARERGAVRGGRRLAAAARQARTAGADVHRGCAPARADAP